MRRGRPVDAYTGCHSLAYALGGVACWFLLCLLVALSGLQRVSQSCHSDGINYGISIRGESQAITSFHTLYIVGCWLVQGWHLPLPRGVDEKCRNKPGACKNAS